MPERGWAVFQKMMYPSDGGPRVCCEEGHPTHREAQKHGNQRFSAKWSNYKIHHHEIPDLPDLAEPPEKLTPWK